mgnify:CR=1 FL=1
MAAALPNRGYDVRIVALIALAITALSAPGRAQAPSAEQVAASVQARYDRIRDFSADFVQQYESGVLKRKLTERGTVEVKKPGKMRWDYTDPEKKLFVSDGSRIYLWVPADNQVTHSPVPKQDEATTAVLFLVGKGNLTRDFDIRFAEGAPEGTYKLRLDPKLPERDYDWLELVVDTQTYQIRSLTAADRQGGQSTFQFTNFKENVGLADNRFNFTIPYTDSAANLRYYEPDFVAVTNQAAKAIAIDSRIGSLEAGKDADLVIWSGNPLSQFTKAEQTWVDGRRYFSLEEDAALRTEIARQRAQLIQAVHAAGAESNATTNRPARGPGQENR